MKLRERGKGKEGERGDDGRVQKVKFKREKEREGGVYLDLRWGLRAYVFRDVCIVQYSLSNGGSHENENS